MFKDKAFTLSLYFDFYKSKNNEILQNIKRFVVQFLYQPCVYISLEQYTNFECLLC